MDQQEKRNKKASLANWDQATDETKLPGEADGQEENYDDLLTEGQLEQLVKERIRMERAVRDISGNAAVISAAILTANGILMKLVVKTDDDSDYTEGTRAIRELTRALAALKKCSSIPTAGAISPPVNIQLRDSYRVDAGGYQVNKLDHQQRFLKAILGIQ